MRLIVDSSVLVGELLRVKGRERLAHERLDLFLPRQMWVETSLALPRRIDALACHRGLDAGAAAELATLCIEAVASNVAGPTQRVVLTAAVSQRLVLDTASDLVEGGAAQPYHMERGRDLGRVGQCGVERGPIGAREVEHAPAG